MANKVVEKALSNALGKAGDGPTTPLSSLSLVELCAYRDSINPSTPEKLQEAETVQRLIDLKPYEYYDVLEDSEVWTITHLTGGGEPSAGSVAYSQTNIWDYTCGATDDLIRIRLYNKSGLSVWVHDFLFTTSEIATARTLACEIRDEHLAVRMNSGLFSAVMGTAAETMTYDAYSFANELNDIHEWPKLVIPPGWYLDFYLSDLLGNSETISMQMGVYVGEWAP
jgi:hypothetical protein